MNCRLKAKLNRKQLTQKRLFVGLMPFNKKILAFNNN